MNRTSIKTASKITLSTIAITIAIWFLNTLAVKQRVENFAAKTFSRESAQFYYESTKRDSIQNAADADFLKRMQAWEDAALNSKEAKALISQAEKNIRFAKADTHKVNRSFRIAKAENDLEKIRAGMFEKYAKQNQRPKAKVISFNETLQSPERKSSKSIWIIAMLIGVIGVGIELEVLGKTVCGIPFFLIGVIYGGVILFMHQDALHQFFGIPVIAGAGLSLFLTISAFINYVKISGNELAGGVKYYSDKMKAFWKLKQEQDAEYAKKKLGEVENKVARKLNEDKAQQQRKFEESMARIKVNEAININKITRQGFIDDAKEMESSVDEMFACERRIAAKLGKEYQDPVNRAFTQRLITMKSAMHEIPDHIAEKPHTNGKSVSPQPEPVSEAKPRIRFDHEAEILMPPASSIEEDARADYGVADPLAPVEDQNDMINLAPIESESVGKSKVSESEFNRILEDVRSRRHQNEKMTVRHIQEVYGIPYRVAHKIRISL